MSSIEQLFPRMEAKKRFRAGSGVSEEQMRAIESSLQIELPNSYRLFLAKYSWASWFGQSIYGVVPLTTQPEENDRDTVEQTVKARNEKLPSGSDRIPL